MKKIVVVAVAVSMYGCYVDKDIQVNMVDAKLVKIDTVFRYPGTEQVLIWQCSNNVKYISYASINDFYKVGSRMRVMVQR